MSRGLAITVREPINATRSLKTLSSLAYVVRSTDLFSYQIRPMIPGSVILLQLGLLTFATSSQLPSEMLV